MSVAKQLSGTGTVCRDDGSDVGKVYYSLWVVEPHASVIGAKNGDHLVPKQERVEGGKITGLSDDLLRSLFNEWPRPRLTLHLDDGRRLEFEIINPAYGSITPLSSLKDAPDVT